MQGRALTFLCRDMTQSQRAAVVVSVLAVVEREVEAGITPTAEGTA